MPTQRPSNKISNLCVTNDSSPFAIKVALSLEYCQVASGLPILGLFPAAITVLYCLLIFALSIVSMPILICISLKDDDACFLPFRLMGLALLHGFYSILNICTLTGFNFMFEIILPYDLLSKSKPNPAPVA